jgi:hypothetical protein
MPRRSPRPPRRRRPARTKTWEQLRAEEARAERQRWALQQRARRGDVGAALALFAGWPEEFARVFAGAARSIVLELAQLARFSEEFARFSGALGPRRGTRPREAGPRRRGPQVLTAARLAEDLRAYPNQSQPQRAARLGVSVDTIRRRRELPPSSSNL